MVLERTVNLCEYLVKLILKLLAEYRIDHLLDNNQQSAIA